jgi:hypothetical protein
MGLLDRLGLTTKRFDTLAKPAAWTLDWNSADPGELAMEALDRKTAMGIPGVARAHHTIVSKLAQMELVADNGSGIDASPQPTFLYRTDLGEPPEFRMWCTADNLFFHGRALWAVDRGALGQITGARWVPLDRWEVDEAAGGVLIDEKLVDPSGYLFFNIPMWGGVLAESHRTLRGALDIERAWTARMRSPVNIIDLHVTDDADLTQDEVDAYVKAWQRKHYSGAPAVGMTPAGIKMETHTNVLGAADLFLQARDTIRTDIGSHASLDGGMVDSSGGASSLTYETQEGQRADFYEFDLPFWTIPITARLSLDDVVPRGTRVFLRFRPIVAPDQSQVSSLMREQTESTSITSTSTPASPAPTTGKGDNAEQG